MKRLIVIIVLISISTIAKAQLSGLEAKLILDNVENSANNILNDAKYTGDELINNAVQNMLNLVGITREAMLDVLGKADKVLTSQQDQFFNNLKTTSDEIFKNIENLDKLINKNINSLGNLLATTIISNKNPVITHFEIPTLVAGNIIDFKLNFYGIQLNNDKNFLKIGNHLIPVDSAAIKTDGQLSFDVSKTIFDTLRKDIKVTLHLFKRKKQEVQNFTIRVLPEQIAKIEFSYLKEYNCDKISKRTVTLPVCRTETASLTSYPKEANCSQLISPTNNRIIDINSVKLSKTHDRNGGGRCDLGTVTNSSIKVTIHSESEDEPYGGSGKVECRCEFNEIEKKTCEKIIQKKYNLKYNQPIVQNIPDIANISSVKITYYNGQEELAPISGMKNKLMQYSYNKTTKTIQFSTVF